MPDMITELIKQWNDQAAIMTLRFERATDSLVELNKINDQLWSECTRQGLNMNELLEESKL